MLLVKHCCCFQFSGEYPKSITLVKYLMGIYWAVFT